jgi:hypothetical protein
MANDDLSDFESKLLIELEESTRPVFPQLITKYNAYKKEGKSHLLSAIFTYSLLALTCPEMFPKQSTAVIQQGPKYLGNFLLAKGFPIPADIESFMQDFCSAISESKSSDEDLITSLVNGFWNLIGEEIYRKNLKANSIAAWIATSNCKSLLVERLTYFPTPGIFTQGVNGEAFLKSLPPNRHPPLGSNIPIGSLVIPKSVLDNAFSSCRSENELVYFDAHRLCLAFVKSKLKNATITWFQQHLRDNWSRTKLQSDSAAVSDLYAFNFEGCMLLFCAPFLSDLGKKVYLKYLPADAGLAKLLEELTTVVDSSPKDPSLEEISFVGHCFWLTLLALNQGTGSIIRNCNGLLKELSELLRVERDVPEFQKNRWYERVTSMVDEKLAFDLFLLDPKRITLIQQFMTFVMLKVSTASVEEFTGLPEFLFDLILDILVYYGHLKVQWTDRTEILVEFLVITLGKGQSATTPRNPYLRAKVVEFLMTRMIPLDALPPSDICLSLIEFYVQVEVTGASTGFYDKFSIRYQLATVMMELLDLPPHFKAMQALARAIKSVTCPFVRFINLLLNDVTYLLDESILKLTEIHKLLNQESLTAGSNELNALERQCTGYMQLANVGTELLEKFTRSTPEPFARPEIVTRLANMLNLVYFDRNIL